MSVVAVVGLGYVGLPLAMEFGKHRKTTGFDLFASRVASYRQFTDPSDVIQGLQSYGIQLHVSESSPSVTGRRWRRPA